LNIKKLIRRIVGLPALGQAAAVAEIVALPDPADPERLCGDDLALVRLRVAVPPSEAVPIVPRVDSPVVKGEPFSGIGFGATEEDASTRTRRTRYRRDGVKVTCIGLDCPRDHDNILSREWSGEDEACAGDSGGAAIDAAGRLVGVHNRGANVPQGGVDLACSGTSIYIHLAKHAAWIKDAVV
jgi:hypothetical protein